MTESVEDKGKRGFSCYYPEEPNSSSEKSVPLFIFRACDEGLEAQVSIDTDIAFTLMLQVGFTFCPWCGKRLAKKAPRWLQKLMEK